MNVLTYYSYLLFGSKECFLFTKGILYHTAGLDTIFVQIYMDALPGVPGVSKNSQKYATNKSVEFLR